MLFSKYYEEIKQAKTNKQTNLKRAAEDNQNQFALSWLLKRLFYFVGVWGLIFYSLSAEHDYYSKSKPVFQIPLLCSISNIHDLL